MKILFLTYSFAPNIGGIESHSLILATELVKAGYEVCLMTLTEHQEADDYPFQVVRKPTFKTSMKWYQWSELVFENNPVLKLSLFNCWFRRPRITAIHTWISRPGGSTNWTARVKQWWLSQAQLVIVVSKALQKSIPQPTVVIPNPYKNDLFYTDATTRRSKSFVFLGRLVSDKGLQIALKAVQLLLQSPLLSPDEKQAIRLTVIGDGPQKMELVQYTQTTGMSEKIDFVGVLKGQALVQALNEHQYIIIPSIWEEPFGMVALEAMACGCIPIASNSGGLPEAISDAGLLFEKGDSVDLGKQMIWLLQDKSLRQELRINAQRHLIDHTAENITGQYMSCIEKFRKAKMLTKTTPN